MKLLRGTTWMVPCACCKSFCPPSLIATTPTTRGITSRCSTSGAYVDVEVRTPRGRVDVVMRTRTTLYVIELKLGQDADVALRQIDLKQYPERFALCGLPVVKAGISFDAERHTLKDWKIA